MKATISNSNVSEGAVAIVSRHDFVGKSDRASAVAGITPIIYQRVDLIGRPIFTVLGLKSRHNSFSSSSLVESWREKYRMEVMHSRTWASSDVQETKKSRNMMKEKIDSQCPE